MEPNEILEQKSLKAYGNKFQLKTLSLLIQDSEFAVQIRPILDSNYYDMQYAKWLVDAVTDYMDKYTQPPGFDTLRTIIDTEVDKSQQKLYHKVLDQVENINVKDRPYIQEQINYFCTIKHAKNKSDEAREAIETGDLEKAQSLAYEAFRPQSGVSEVFDLKRDYQKVWRQETHRPVPTPLDPFNKVSKGGPGSGDLVVAIGPSSFGKTAYMTAQARLAAQLGYKVAYFSLETKDVQIAQRAVAGLIGVSQERLEQNQESIEAGVEALSGNIQFMQYPATKATIPQIKLGVQLMKASNFFPDLIIIDGLNQLKLPGKRTVGDDNNAKYEYLCEWLRDEAKAFQVPVHTVFQTNRSGMNTEVNDEQNIGKAIETFQVADWVIIFSQTVEQQEDGEARVRLLKNRLGPKGLTLLLDYDPDQGTFEVKNEEKLSALYNGNKNKEMREGLDNAKKFLNKRKQEKLKEQSNGAITN